MSRRRRVVMCKSCGTRPVRQRKYAQFCSPCWAKQGRPQRECSVCGESFSKDTMLGTRCRPCVSLANHSKRVQETYGLQPGEYELLLDNQDGKCAICFRKPGAKRLAVDHDHTTGEVRGLLCRGCNRDVLGHLREDWNSLQRAIDYLHNPPARRVLNREA